jgi:hypothetical protein
MSRGRGIAAAVILVAALLVTWIRGAGHRGDPAAAPPTTAPATSSAPASNAATATSARAPYVTSGFRDQLAADGPAAWQANVVDRRQVSTCAPVAAVPMPEAPRTATETHVRVVVDQTLARDGARAAPARTDYPLRLTRVAGRWLVDGYSVGG